MSATFSPVSTYRTETVLSRTNERKWWYLSAMCFVRGRMRGDSTRSIHPLLSSWTVQCITGVPSPRGITLCSSRSRLMRGMTSRKDGENAIYSLSVVDNAISVWSLLLQMIGQLAYRTTYPVRERTEDDSSLHSLFHSPAKDASTKVSMLRVLSGRKRMPSLLVRCT